MGYFIEHEGGRQGPLDILDIIRKIRNGALDKKEMISRDDDIRPKPAYQHPELYDIFIEQEQFEREQDEAGAMRQASFGSLMKRGFGILREDMTTGLFTGMWLILCFGLIYAGYMYLPRIAAAIIIPYVIYLAFQFCLVVTMRLSRVQLLSSRFLSDLMKKHWLSIVLVAIPTPLIAFTIPWLLMDILKYNAWAITLVIGLPLMAYTFYLPLLVVDRNIGAKEAFSLNNRAIKAMGLELILLLVGVIVLNVISAALVAPVLFVLPVSLLALMELYNDYFSEH